MLSVHAVDVDIQGSRILSQVSIDIAPNEFVCLIGRNGAGKSTTFRTIMGQRKPSSGRITLQGRDVTGLPTFEIARLGIGFSPEESEVFADLTVAENIEMPTWIATKTGRDRRPAAECIAEAYDLFPKLAGYKERGGGQLSGGERKMLSIARAIALDPQLLLLDEPFEGLSPIVIPQIAEGLATVRKSGRSILVAESQLHHVPEYTDRLYVIERGEIIFNGSVAEAERDAAIMTILHGTE